MKSNLYTLLIVFASLFAAVSCDNDVWNDLPSPIANFFTTYFPDGEVNSYTKGESTSVVSVRNGVTVTFNSDNVWIDVNGNGSTLPPVFLYDQLPAPLYNYLQEMEAMNGVYRVDRNATRYKVELHNSYVEYTIATGEIYYPTAPSPDAMTISASASAD